MITSSAQLFWIGSHSKQVQNLVLALVLSLLFLGYPGRYAEAAAPSYNITDIGLLGPVSSWYGTDAADYSYAKAINNGGITTGNVYFPVNVCTTGSSPYCTPFGNNHAFKHDNSTLADLHQPSTGYVHSYGRAINNSNIIVGYGSSFDQTNPPPDTALVWSGGTATSLGTLGGSGSIANGINNSNQVVGAIYTQIGSTLGYVHDLDNNTTTYLGSLGGNYTYANAIDNSGIIVGASTLVSGSFIPHAFVYNNGVMTDLGTLGGPRSEAVAINDFGMIAGTADTLFAKHAALWNNGVIMDLGTLSGGTESRAYGINDVGWVVGMSWDTSKKAFLYNEDGMLDLNTLIDPNTGWTLQEATDINDNGWIVGSGIAPDGRIHAYVLTPTAVPIPSAIFLFASGMMTLLALRKKR